MTKCELDSKERLEYYLEMIERKPIHEIITFPRKYKSLYIRFHKFRMDRKIADAFRELIDLGLKAKGY